MRWLKIETHTPNKPAIVNLARDCRCSRGDAFLAFFRLFSWLDEQTADGVVFTDRREVDETARLPGACASLERSGWLAFDGNVMTVANWNEHNGQSAKRRALDAKRKNEIRDAMRREGLPVRSLPPTPVRFQGGQPCPLPMRTNVRLPSGQNADEIR